MLAECYKISTFSIGISYIFCSNLAIYFQSQTLLIAFHPIIPHGRIYPKKIICIEKFITILIGENAALLPLFSPLRVLAKLYIFHAY